MNLHFVFFSKLMDSVHSSSLNKCLQHIPKLRRPIKHTLCKWAEWKDFDVFFAGKINCRADHLFAVALAFVAGLYFGVVDDDPFGASKDESHLSKDDALVVDVEVAVFFAEVELDVCHRVFEI
jgi:hypothetical protein